MLVEEIWNTIALDSSALPLPHSQRAELGLRIAEHVANPEDVVPWQAVRTSIRDRLKR